MIYLLGPQQHADGRTINATAKKRKTQKTHDKGQLRRDVNHSIKDNGSNEDDDDQGIWVFD